jgi:hypothetical protein
VLDLQMRQPEEELEGDAQQLKHSMVEMAQ